MGYKMKFDIIKNNKKIKKDEYLKLIDSGFLFDLYKFAKEKDMFIQVYLDNDSFINSVKIILEKCIVISGGNFVISDNEIHFIEI